MNATTRSFRLGRLGAVGLAAAGVVACWLVPAGAAGGVIASPFVAANPINGADGAAPQEAGKVDRPALPFDPTPAASEAWHPSTTLDGHWFEVRPADHTSDGLPTLSVRTASDPSTLEAPPPLTSPAAPPWTVPPFDGDPSRHPFAEPAPAVVPLPPALFTGLGAAIGCGAVGWLHRRLSRPGRWRYA